MLSEAANIEFDGTMEDAESILESAGYIPKLDTLSAISRVNSWVKKRYFEDKVVLEKGLSVVILKSIVDGRGWLDSIENDFYENGYKILKFERFDEDRVQILSRVLRGGNWYVPMPNKYDYLPKYAYLLLDENLKKPYENQIGTKESRIRILKEMLRKKYDNSLFSFIHATDDTSQACEYVEDIWPQECEKTYRQHIY